jgi:hypothetical protein
MSISDKKSMEIANVCYANVAGQFAMFCNPKYRGPNFTWSEFANMMEGQADTWMMIHRVRGHKEDVNKTAALFAREIAERLVTRAEF